MTKKASKLINENVIRRWGKLANMPALTENFLETLEDETVEEAAHEDEMDAAEDEIAAGEDEMEAGMEAEASMEEKEAVEDIVRAVVDAIAAETGVDIEVEGEAGDEGAMDDMDMGMDASDELDDDADMDMDDADAAMRNKKKAVNPRMRDPEMRDMAYNRDDELEEGKHGMGKGDQSKTRADYSKNKDKKADRKEDKKEREAYDKKSKKSGSREGDQSKSKADFEEALDLEIVDDEALTEAVLKRVVERLLKKN